jgi:HNH endonuclease.
MEYYTIPLKTCTKCNRLLPATTFFFPRHTRKTGGLRPRCKTCHNEDNRAWRENNPEKDAETKKQWNDKNPQRNLRYYQANREWYLEYSRQHRETNREIQDEQQRIWKKNNPEKVRAIYQRYMARKHNLPDTFTGGQWLHCLEYFNYCCAVCGRQLKDLLGMIEPQADHWIALSNPDCPGTVADNMVCLCNHCNVSKGAKSPLDWLIEKYGKRKAKDILARIETYFASVSAGD